MSGTDFDSVKAGALRLAPLLAKAGTPQELRALMLADAAAPWHSFNLFELTDWPRWMGERLMDLMSDDLDENGVPT